MSLSKKYFEEFKATDDYKKCYSVVHYTVLRGRNGQASEIQAHPLQFNDNFTDATNPEQIINVIYFACKGVTPESRLLVDGDVSLVSGEERKLFEKVVEKLTVKKILIIPLLFGIRESNGNWKGYNTLLIKSKATEGGDNIYIDLTGSVYRSFQQFLDNNRFPISLLCYPSKGVLKIDAEGNVELQYKLVGVTNAMLSVADVAMATVGFFHPNLTTSTYFAIRGIHQLYDARHHGRSINPANDSEAMVNWIQIISNVVYIGSVGLQCSNLLGTALPNATAQTYANVIATTAKTLLKPIEWNALTPGEQVSCCAALCFAYYEVFSLDNFNRLIEKVRLDALCETFAKFTQSDFNKALFLQMLNSNSAHVLSLLNLASDWVKNQVEVALTSDLITITILGYSIPFENILQLDESDLSCLMEILRGIGKVFFEDFLVMVRAYGIVPVIRLMYQRSTELGGNFLLAYNQTLGVMKAFRQVRHDAIADIDVVDYELILRTGRRYTINSAIETLGDDPGSSPALQSLVVE